MRYIDPSGWFDPSQIAPDGHVWYGPWTWYGPEPFPYNDCHKNRYWFYHPTMDSPGVRDQNPVPMPNNWELVFICG